MRIWTSRRNCSTRTAHTEKTANDFQIASQTVIRSTAKTRELYSGRSRSPDDVLRACCGVAAVDLNTDGQVFVLRHLRTW